MNEIFQALILGIVQGLSEFLPISSTGHLIIVPWFFGWDGVVSTLSFDLALHLGTTLAVVSFFWQDWLKLVLSFLKQIRLGWKGVWRDEDSRLFVLLVVGSIPAGFFGVLLEKLVEAKLRSPLLIAVTLIIFSAVLYWADSLNGKRVLRNLGLKDSLFVGFSQVIALIPGISRSGSTITSGLFLGLDRQAAAKFSFLLSTPVILGAVVFKFKDIGRDGLGTHLDLFLVGFLASAISGFFAIKFLLAFLQRNNFRSFIVYRVLLGLVILGILFLRN